MAEQNVLLIHTHDCLTQRDKKYDNTMHLNDALNTLIFFKMLTLQKFNVTGKLKATTKTIFVF